MARVSFTRTWGKETGVEYIRGTLPDGEELVLLDDADADLMVDGLDPRGTTLQLRREALASQSPSSSKSTGH
jgi:hypothetical protein